MMIDFRILLTFALTAVMVGGWMPAPLTAHALGQTTAQSVEVERVTVDELKTKIDKKEPVTVIDVRSGSSYDATDTKIKGALRIAPDEVEARLKEIPTTKPVVTYCT